MNAPELRPLVDVGRFARAALSAPLTVSTERSLIAPAVHTGHTWSVEPDRIVGTAHGAATGRDLDADMVRVWCRDHRVGLVDGDVYGRTWCDDPETAAAVADEVAALVRGAEARSRRLTTKSLAQVLAERLVTGRTLFVRDGALWWRWAAPVNPVTGQGVPGQPVAERPGPAGLPSSLAAAFRRAPADGTLITPDVVRAAVEGARLLQSNEQAPPWPDVVRSLRVLAGLPADPAPDAGDGTKWLRRSKS